MHDVESILSGGFDRNIDIRRLYIWPALKYSLSPSRLIFHSPLGLKPFLWSWSEVTLRHFTQHDVGVHQFEEWNWKCASLWIKDGRYRNKPMRQARASHWLRHGLMARYQQHATPCSASLLAPHRTCYLCVAIRKGCRWTITRPRCMICNFIFIVSRKYEARGSLP